MFDILVLSVSVFFLEETSVSKGKLNAHVSDLFLFTYIHLTATESSIHLKSLAFTLVATITSFARELNPSGVGEHIYIVIHRQTASFYIYIYIYIYILDDSVCDH